MKKRVLALTMALCLALSLLPVSAGAEGLIGEGTSSDPYFASTADELAEALEQGGYIKLGNDFTVESEISVPVDKTVELDLNGKTLTFSGSNTNRLKVFGNATVMDSSGDGKIVGAQLYWTYGVIDVQPDASLKVEGGAISVYSGEAVYLRGNTSQRSTFSMTKGTIEIAANGDGIFALGADISVEGGRIVNDGRTGCFGIKGNSTTKITIGVDGGENHNDVYITSIRAQAGTGSSLIFNDGIIGRINGSLNESDVLNGLFEQNISSFLSNDKMCEEVVYEGKTYYRVTEFTEDKAEAKIGETLYASAIAAAEALKDNETLTLLKDISGNSSGRDGVLVISARNVVVDLNGYSVTDTYNSGIGISINNPNEEPLSECIATVKNSNSSSTSTITAATPLRFKSGNSLYLITANLEGNIDLVTTDTSDGAQRIELGTGALLAYSEDAAVMVGNGGFKATHADGQAYIHATASAAIEADTNKTAVLLNDYIGGNALVLNGGTGTIDLNEKTYTSTGTAVKINASNTNLTIKNGEIVSGEGADGAEVGIPPNDLAPGAQVQPYNNISLTLDGVELVVNDGEFGIVTNGTSSNINVTLKNGSVLNNATGDIGIYFPVVSGTLTIEDSSISAGTGIAVKGGTVNISGNSEIHATGEKRAPAEPVNGGVNETGDAIYVEGNYERAVTVNITGGTFTSVNGYAVQKLFEDQGTGDKKIEITGGNYSSNVMPYLEANYTLTPNADGTFEVVEATDEELKIASVTMNGITTEYENLDNAIEAVNAAADGTSVTLTLLQNQITDSTIVFDKNLNITVDLNGKVLRGPDTGYVFQFGSFEIGSATSAGACDYTNTGTLTIKNGTVIGYRGVLNYFGSVILDAGLTMNAEERLVNSRGGRITVQGADLKSDLYGVFLFNSFYAYDLANTNAADPDYANSVNEKNQSAEFVMTSGSIEAFVYTVGGNNLYSAGTKATISGGTLTADEEDGNCIYWPMEGELNISGTAVISGGTAIEARMGTINISGGTITGTAAPAGDGDRPTSGDPWVEGSALLISSEMYGRGTQQSKGNPNVTVNVTGGTLTSQQGVGIKVYNTEGDQQKADVTVSGGAVSGNLGAIQSVTTGGDTVVTNGSQQTASKSQTTLTVSGGVAPASINSAGKTTYYTNVGDAVKSVDTNSGAATQITVFGNTALSTDVELTDQITLVVTPGVTISADVTSGESGKVVVATTDENGNTEYKLAAVENPGATYPASIADTAGNVVAHCATLEQAVQMVQNGQTITLTQKVTVKDPITVSRPVTFTIDPGDTGSTYTIEAGSGYQLSKNGNTYTISVYTPPVVPDDQPSSSSGGSSEPSYSPVMDITGNGDVRVNPRTPSEGDEVTITVDPDRGYEVDEVIVRDRNGNRVDVTAERNGTYTFEQPRGRVTIEVTFVPTRTATFFNDVPESFWAYNEIAWAYENGYVNGTTTTTFSPNASISRQQVWMILARLSGADPANMAAARQWAIDNGISDGTTPGNAVTRQQLVALLYRYATLMGYANDARADLSIYPDAGTVASYAVEPMQWSVANNIVAGTSDGTLNPSGTATRAQFAVILYRFWEQIG